MCIKSWIMNEAMCMHSTLVLWMSAKVFYVKVESRSNFLLVKVASVLERPANLKLVAAVNEYTSSFKGDGSSNEFITRAVSVM